MTASGVSGTYAGTVPPSPLIRATLSYDPTHIYLTLLTQIVNAAITRNQMALARQLDSITAPNANQALLLMQLMELPPNSAGAALESLSGFQHGEDVWTTQVTNRQFIRRLYDPLRSIVTNSCCNPCSQEWTVWLEGGGGYTRLRGNQNAHGFRMHSYEVTAGVQSTFCSSWTAGIATSYEYDHLHYKQQGGSGKDNTWWVGLYGLYRPACYYGLIDLTYGYSWNSLHRKIIVGPLHYTARSKPRISQINFYGEVGIDVAQSWFLFQPFFGIEAGGYYRQKVTEKQADGWALAIQKKSWSTTTSRLGFHFTMGTYCNTDISIDAAWNALFYRCSNSVHGEFVDFGNSYTIKGITLNNNSIDYAVTLSKDIFSDLLCYLEFTGESWSHLTTLNLLGGLQFHW